MWDALVGWFLTPPSVWDEHVVSTPDAGPDHALEDLDDPEATPGDTEHPSPAHDDPPATRRSKT